MKFRSPTGRFVTNSLIRAKLQLDQEKLDYSSSYVSVLNAYDLDWMNSHLVQLNKMNNFILSYQDNGLQLNHLIRQMKLAQFDEYFIDHTRLMVFRHTGVRLKTSELNGAWYRRVNFDLLSSKLYLAYVLVSSIKYSSKQLREFRPACNRPSFKQGWVSRYPLELEGQAEEITGLSLLQIVYELLVNLRRNPSQINQNLLVVKENRIELQLNQNTVKNSIDNEDGLSIMFCYNLRSGYQYLKMSSCTETLEIDLVQLASMLNAMPVSIYMTVIYGYVQSSLEPSQLEISYDQIRMVTMLVTMLVLENLTGKAA